MGLFIGWGAIRTVTVCPADLFQLVQVQEMCFHLWDELSRVGRLLASHSMHPRGLSHDCALSHKQPFMLSHLELFLILYFKKHHTYLHAWVISCVVVQNGCKVNRLGENTWFIYFFLISSFFFLWGKHSGVALMSLSSTWPPPSAGLHRGFKQRGGFIWSGEGASVQAERRHADRSMWDSDTEQHGSESWKEGMKVFVFMSLHWTPALKILHTGTAHFLYVLEKITANFHVTLLYQTHLEALQDIPVIV